MPTVMFDSVNLDQIPGDAPAVAGYTTGQWPTWAQLAGRWPNARRLSIAVSAAHDAECLDVEQGDATPDQAPSWVRRQEARGIVRPVVYTSVSVAQHVLDLLAAAGIPRPAVRLWTAHYTHTPHICSPACGYGLSTTADATQWTDRSLGRNLDESLVADAFFDAPPAPAPTPSPTEAAGMNLTTEFHPNPQPLDAGGHGWIDVPHDFATVDSLIVQGPNPPIDGYWPPVHIEAQPRDGQTRVTFYGAPGQQTGVFVKVLSP